MCLAIPGRVKTVESDGPMRIAKVDFGGVAREINLTLVPEAGIGDHVLVHAGFAITRIDEAEAARVWEALRQIDALDDERPS
ncbi:MAG: HypC/HybG/HupF family hydrogenase formation chaperone [Bryobacterales bacterium]|nr:HypC/HybG/HupF family hydrogenase formation chaperone [Bryobacterales bacterium]